MATGDQSFVFVIKSVSTTNEISTWKASIINNVTMHSNTNRPFYSCLLSDLALHNKSIEVCICLYQNKLNSSLAAMQRPGHWADNCKMVYWSLYM